MRWICTVLMAALAGQAALEIPAGITRIAGMDQSSGIEYVLISVEGKLMGADGAAPRLTAQCTKGTGGKLRFDLLADLPGDPPRLAFYPPWQKRPGELFPPPLEKLTVTMEFLGYTKVKPMKRQWVTLRELPGEMQYATPGGGSSNMEEVTFFLRYLKALPTLRLSVPGKAAEEFETAQWQQAVKAEPLCGASGI